MDRSFGDILRQARLDSGVGLRELARRIDKSAGYLSDVENGRVAPPSEGVILDLAGALMVDKKDLLQAARKVDPELSDYVAQDPEAADFLRIAKAQKFDKHDWEQLERLAKKARLGRKEGGR
ncbi:MAG: helix-turn-helix domain-containing protein [Deltaproteobacteria bacterium]|nr:helix-turn-helix domain-containing protein [Deltaproteobacteria bacterium]